MTRNNEGQSTFDFKDVQDTSYLPVSDFRTGDKVKIPNTIEGDLITKLEIDYGKEDGESNVKTVHLLKCEKDGVKVNIKLNNTNLVMLKNVCDSHIDKLLGRTFSVHLEGSGQFQSIKLLVDKA